MFENPSFHETNTSVCMTSSKMKHFYTGVFSSVDHFTFYPLLFLLCYQILNMLLIHLRAVAAFGMFLSLLCKITVVVVCLVDYFLQTTTNRFKNYLCFSCWITNQPVWLTHSVLPNNDGGAMLTTKVENYPGNSNNRLISVSKDAVIISESDSTNCSSHD